MTRRKGKSVSFDAMVKFFLQNYGIPTKTDLDQIIEKMDRLEKLIRASGVPGKGRRAAGRKKTVKPSAKEISEGSAADQVLKVVAKYKKGAGLKEIQEKTEFGEKKIRNILYRLYKMKKIQRKGRGVYSVV
jgi:hypothetical protein